MDKKVSVIVSIYNTAKYLPRCLDSILNQTYKNFELICVDDCSQDNSLEILKEYSMNNSCIKIIENEFNRGQSFSKNLALDCASGDYISFIDSDDFISPDFLEEMVILSCKKEADIIMCDSQYENKEKRTFNKKLSLTGTYSTLYKKLSILKNGSCCDKLFKSDFIKKYGIKFPDGYIYEDNEFLTKSIYYANKICTTKKCVYYCYCNPTSTTRKKTNFKELKKSASILLGRIFDFYNDKSLTKKELKLLTRFCINSFCGAYIEDDDFILPSLIDKHEISKMLAKPKYKNIFQRIFSLMNTSKKTKILTILFIPIRLKRKIKNTNR